MLFDLLRRAAAEVPRQPVVVTSGGELTYADALHRAAALSRGLRARSSKRFACLVDDVGDLIALLCAASAVGAEPCVYPDRLTDLDIGEFAEPFDHDVVITDRSLTGPPAPVSIEALAVEGEDAPEARQEARLLILTTGTTGRPKGVRHEWARLLESVRHPDPEPGARWLLAYNLNQFAGIQILLHVLASRATLVVGASRDPGDALDAMLNLGVTHASGTPTFWRLVLGRLRDDTPARLRLQQLTLGGEAVPQPLLDELRRRFPNVRISQVYAASEFGSAVSVRDGRAGLPLSVLERGEDSPVQFRVVEGELHARSRVGMLGYLGHADADEGWRPTGDLVEVRDDRIHFVGRTSEIINVGGVKVHPLPVEEVLDGIDGVEVARVYGRRNPVAGEIVAADVVARAGVDATQLDMEIRAACEQLPPAARPRRIRFVDELELRDTKLARPAGSA